METTLSPEGAGFVLSGVKRYIGNGTRAELGVLMARSRALGQG